MALEQWRPTTSLMRRGPILELERQMEDAFDRVLHGWPGRRMAEDYVGMAPPLDMIDRKNEILLRADLPGIERKDIHLSVENGVLTLQGSRVREREDKDLDYFAVERWNGAFSRSLALPQGVDRERIEASFRNGVLEVHLPKTQDTKGKSIEIRAA
jgi:HSP20 family protein